MYSIYIYIYVCIDVSVTGDLPLLHSEGDDQVEGAEPRLLGVASCHWLFSGLEEGRDYC